MVPGNMTGALICRLKRRWSMTVEKISAVTLKVTSMQTSVQFYRDLLGMEVIYGGDHAAFFLTAYVEPERPDPQSRARSGHYSVGTAYFLCATSGCVLELCEEKGISARDPSGCLVGRTVLPHVRSGRSRVIVCVSASMSFPRSRMQELRSPLSISRWLPPAGWCLRVLRPVQDM